ncbi:MAG: hypothetical protein ACPGOV_17045 [Magnetovibrionaceae bacterium]
MVPLRDQKRRIILLLAALGMSASLSACEAVQATPILSTAVNNADVIVPFLPEVGSVLLTGKPLSSHVKSAFLRDGCDKLVEEAAVARCNARNVGPRKRNYRGFPY